MSTSTLPRHSYRIAALLVVLGLPAVGLAIFAVRAPERLPQPLALVTCLVLSHAPVGTAQCGCAAVVMKATVGDDFASRQQLLTTFVETCNDRDPLPTPETTNVARLQQALGVVLENPDAFSIERVQELAALGAQPGTGPKQMPYYPASTHAESEIMRWFFSAATKQPDAGADLPALTGADARRHPRLAAKLQGMHQARGCLLAWSRARSSGDWESARSGCAGVALPSVAAACMRAELTSSGKAGAKTAVSFVKASPSPEQFDCSREDPCRLSSAADQLLLPIPPAQPMTFAGLAQLASTREQMAHCLERVSGFPSMLRWLAEFLGPSTNQEREAAISNLSKSSVAELTAALANCSGVPAAAPTMRCSTRGGLSVSISVPKERVVEAVCLLAGPPTEDNGTAPSWLPAFSLAAMAHDESAGRLADLSIQLMNRLPLDDEVLVNCRLKALLRRAAPETSRSRSADVREAGQLLERFAQKPQHAVMAHLARCRLTAEAANPEKATSIATKLLQMGEEAAAHRCATIAVVTGLQRHLPVNTLLVDDGPLANGPLADLRELRDSCSQGGPCQPSDEVRAVMDPPAAAVDESADDADEDSESDEETEEVEAESNT